MYGSGIRTFEKKTVRVRCFGFHKNIRIGFVVSVPTVKKEFGSFCQKNSGFGGWIHS